MSCGNVNVMKRAERQAFTLVEMLVVIAVMSVLAAMIFPITGAVNRTKVRTRTRAEMEQIITAIENYQAKVGHYPPDNALLQNADPQKPISYLPACTNQLFYELLGTTFTPPRAYQTSDGRSQVRTNDFGPYFGVTGFANSTTGGGGDEGTTVVECLRGSLRANQVADLAVLPAPYSLKVLVGSVPVPANLLTGP